MRDDAFFRKRGQRLLFSLPERMVLRHSQNQVGFQRPVWRAGGVIVLTHRQVRISKTEGQNAVPIGDGLLLPPAQMAQHDALHNPRREHLQTGKGDGTPEGDHCKAIGQAATKRYRGTVGG